MKKIITAALAAALLAVLTGALAGDAGTASDPLITKEYAEGAYADGLDSRWAELMEGALGPVYDRYAARFGGKGAQYTFTSGQEHFSLASGGSFTGSIGCGVTVLSGSVTVTYSAGSVIDIAAGSVTASGTALKSGRRYFVAEDTEAVFAASSDATIMVDGPYKAASGMERSEPKPVGKVYNDVNDGDWFSSAAVYAKERKIFRDHDAGLFRPDDTLTRVEMAYALWMAAGAPETNYVTGYSDAPEAFYLPAVNWCAGQKIMNGVGVNLFGTQDILDRATVAVVLYRASGAGVEGIDLGSFADVSLVPDWAMEGVSWCVSNGVIRGFEDNTIGPLRSISRAELATVLMRIYP